VAYRGGLGRVKRGRRYRGYDLPNLTTTTPQSSAWDFASEMLGRGVSSLGRGLSMMEQRRRQEEDRDRQVMGKLAQEARDTQEEKQAAEMNLALAEHQAAASQPGYVPPEGEITPSEAPSMPPTAAQLAGEMDELAAAKFEEAEERQELEDKAAKEATEVERKDAQISAGAQRTYNSYLNAKDTRDARIRNMEEVEAQRAAGQDVSAQVAATRQDAQIDRLLSKQRAKLEDNGKLYGSLTSEWNRDQKAAGEKTTGRRAEYERDAWVRKTMEARRASSGFYTPDPETGDMEWDEEKAQRIARSVVGEPVVRPGASYTQEDWDRANEIRYTMPSKMLDWKPGMWEAQGLGPAEALQMAAAGARQASRLARQEPVAAASGRRESVSASVASGGIGSSSGAPAKSAPSRQDEEDELLLTEIASTGVGTMDMPPEGPVEPAPPLAPPPAESAVPPAAPPEAPAPQEALPPEPDESETWVQSVFGPVTNEDRPSAQELADASNLEEEIEKGIVEKAMAAIEESPTVQLDPRYRQAVAARKEKEAEQAATRAKEMADLRTELADLEDKDWSDEAKTNKALQIQKKLNIMEYGSEVANVIETTKEAMMRDIAKGKDPIEAQEWAQQHILKVVESKQQAARGQELDEKAAEAAANWDQLHGTLTDPAEFGKFALTTGIPMAVAAATGVAGVGLVGRLALTAFSAGGMDLAMQGGVLDEQGRVDFERIRSAGIEGLTSVTEVPAVGGIMSLVKKTAGKKLLGKVAKYTGAAVMEGLEEPFQQTLASVIDKGELPSQGELAVAATLGSMMGPAFAAAVPGGVDGVDPKTQAQASKELDLALEAIKSESPELFDTDFLEGLEEGELQARVADAMPAVEAAVEAYGEKISRKVKPEALPMEEGEVEAALEAAAAEEAVEPAPAPEPEVVPEKGTVVPEKGAKAESFEKAEPGQEVEGPAEVAPMLPDAKWLKVDKDTYSTSVEGNELRVQVNQEGLTLSAAEAAETYGTAEGEARPAIGLFKPERTFNLKKADLIQLAAGTGRKIGGHELLHFMRHNGLIRSRDWNTLKVKYAKDARAYAKRDGHADWGKLDAETQGTFLEEAIADALGAYARGRYGDKVKIPKPLQKVWQMIHDFGRRVTGTDVKEFDRLLRGEYAKFGKAQPPVPKGKLVGGFEALDAGEGFVGQRSERTGTWGLRGPAGEKLAGKITDGTLAVKSIGKGAATSSRSLVDAMRRFAKSRGLKRIVMSSTQAELTPAAVRWRDNMVKRGEAIYNEKGEFEIQPEAPPKVRAKAVQIDAKGRILDKVAQKLNLSYFLATEARAAGAEVPGNVGAKKIPEPKNKAQKVGAVMMGRVTDEQWLERNSEALGGIGSSEWKASMGWYQDLRSAFAREFGEKNADKMLMLWGVSQQRASASKGMADVFTAEDIAKGFRKEKQAGLASERMVNILSGKAGTLGQKLADFMDSIRGSDTRSWVGNDERGGQPAAFDVWAQRDVGYVDKRVAEWAKEQGVDLEVEFDTAPTDAEYHYGLRRYQQLADFLNKKKVDGRKDWKASQAQAIGWMAIQKVMGVTPETVVDIFEKNRAQVAAEARPGGSVDPAAQKRFDALSKKQQARITTQVIKRIAPRIAEATGARVQSIDASEGMFEGDVTPNAVLSVLGSADQIQGFSDAMAKVMAQDEVWAIKTDGAKGKRNAIAIDISGTKPFTFSSAAKMYAQAFGKDGGYTLLPDGRIRVLVPFTNPTPTRLSKYQQDTVDRLGLLGDDTMTAVIGGAEVVIGKGGPDEGPGPRRVDGVEGVGDLSQSYREAYDEAIAEAEGAPRARAAVDRKRTGIWADVKRRFTKPFRERLREVTTSKGRKVGAYLSEQIDSRQEYMERKLSRLRHGYRKALRAFKTAEGKNWESSWAQVAQALDGQTTYKELNPTQKKMFLAGRAIFNTVKTDAIENGTFTGQVIYKYFPHMRTDLEQIDPIQDHLDYLRENDPKRLDSLRDKDWEWMSGVVGEAADYELAAKDMNRNWKNERWWKQNPHLEKHRGPEPGTYRMDADVIEDYLSSTYPRIATARFFGAKSQVINEAVSSITDSTDREFVLDSLRSALGFNPRRGFGGKGVEAVVREFQALSGLTKLGMAAIPQLTQVGPAVAEAGRLGFGKATRNVFRSGVALFNGEALDNAMRAGSTFAAEGVGGSEIQRAQYGAGTGSFTEAAFKKIFSLGGAFKPGEKIVTSTYGVIPLDKAARVVADGIAREFYLTALEDGNRDVLLDLLGTPELVNQVLSADRPLVGELRRRWREGRLDETVYTSKMARPAEGDPTYVGKNLDWKRGVENMDIAAKRFTDKTQYRTRPQDAPLAFQAPAMKWANTFLSFMYQHWRWQANHVKAVAANAKSNPTVARGHARAVILQNLLLAPILGQAAFSARALLTGRGNEEEEDFQTPGEAFDAVMGLDPIKATDKWTAALRYLQGWQYAGGIGYPMTIVERWRRGASRADTARGLVSAAGGAPTESVFDMGVFLLEATKYAEKAADGRATEADRRKLKRAAWRTTSHLIPNPFGIAGGLRREAGATERYPNVSPGWLGFLWDPEAEWTMKEGVTSPTYREGKIERREKRAEKLERERERAEEERLFPETGMR
jgi:hypothetical protein